MSVSQLHLLGGQYHQSGSRVGPQMEGLASASPPNGSERIDLEEKFLVIGDKNASLAIAIVLDGVFAGLTPLLLVPLGCGVLCAERPGLSAISRGGDLDFFLDAEQPVMPSTCDAVILEASDAITVSTITCIGSQTKKKRINL